MIRTDPSRSAPPPRTVQVLNLLTGRPVTVTSMDAGHSSLIFSISDQAGQPVTELRVSIADANQIASVFATGKAARALNELELAGAPVFGF
jgi:hypothetical protein